MWCETELLLVYMYLMIRFVLGWVWVKIHFRCANFPTLFMTVISNHCLMECLLDMHVSLSAYWTNILVSLEIPYTVMCVSVCALGEQK